MALRTAEQYREGLRDGRQVYITGRRVDDVTVDPYIRVGVETAAHDFLISHDPEQRALCVMDDPETGEPISRYFELPETPGTVRTRFDLIGAACRYADNALPFVKDVGSDILNGVTAVVRGMGHGVYQERIDAYRRHCARNDLALAGAVTDVKGDRSKSPSQQDSPHYYLRVVEETDHEIVVCGAKAHITASPYVDEILVLPTRSLGPDEADCAVAFAVPADAEGLTHICRPSFRYEDPSHFPTPNPRRGHVEALLVFDHVRVPKERVFLLREAPAAQYMAYAFAAFHRFTAVTYKIPILESMAGAGLLAAEANGVQRASHVKERIINMIRYTETTRALALTAIEHTEQMGQSGLYVANRMYSNMAKMFYASHFHEFIRDIQDIAGGLLVTQPTYQDWQNETLRPHLERYLGGAGGYDAEQRLRLMSSLHHLVASDFAGWHEVCTIHAEGSLATQKMMLLSEAPLEAYKERARELIGVEVPGR